MFTIDELMKSEGNVLRAKRGNGKLYYAYDKSRLINGKLSSYQVDKNGEPRISNYGQFYESLIDITDVIEVLPIKVNMYGGK
jgi:hypothetical protein